MDGDAATQRNQEANLIDLVEHIARDPADRGAVHIRLSMLRPHNRCDHHLRIAREIISEQVQPFAGQIFSLTNGDIVFVCKWSDRQGIDQAVDKLRQLFRADPLARDAGGDGEMAFRIWHDLESDSTALIDAVKTTSGDGDRGIQAERPRKALQPLDPKVLGQVEEALRQADLTTLIRRQWMYAVTRKSPVPEPILQEYFVAMGDLKDRVLPDFDLFANRYLFQHLTETLDRRMLSALVKTNQPREGSRISININLSTLLSPEFIAFDKRMNSDSRGATAFELQISDVFADLANFFFVRDYLQAKGYRVAIDGVTHLTLPFLDRERLNVDLVKMYWSADLADYLEGENAQLMQDFVERAGSDRVILCRVDDEDAIRIGHSFGIQLFQGRHVDAMRNAAGAERQAAG